MLQSPFSVLRNSKICGMITEKTRGSALMKFPSIYSESLFRAMRADTGLDVKTMKLLYEYFDAFSFL